MVHNMNIMMSFNVQVTNLQTITHKFLITGQPHCEGDADHIRIEKSTKLNNIQVTDIPQDWCFNGSFQFQVTEIAHNYFKIYPMIQVFTCRCSLCLFLQMSIKLHTMGTKVTVHLKLLDARYRRRRVEHLNFRFCFVEVAYS